MGDGGASRGAPISNVTPLTVSHYTDRVTFNTVSHYTDRAIFNIVSHTLTVLYSIL